MITMRDIASPLAWVGGKHAAASRILATFPSPQSYATYVEVFGGAAHILLQKPPYKHVEVFNDLHGDLIRFWMAARHQTTALQERIDTLPFSRAVFSDYRESLVSNEPMDDLERAARWFYAMRSTFGGGPNFNGWGYTVSGNNKAHSLRTATALLTQVAVRFRDVQVEQGDFEKVIRAYETPTTLLYCDPPYIDCEAPYDVDGVPPFTLNDHRRLATLLNTTSARVALSYYEHPLIDELYPVSHWRRMTWMQAKAIEKTRGVRQRGQELLLMNYPASSKSLWNEHENALVS